MNPDDSTTIGILRRELHAYPELSGQELGTVACLSEFLLPCSPSRLINGLGGNGLAAVFEAASGAPGPTVALRAELDALPIQETGDHPHASQHEGVAHLCGHDGHMAALCGVGLRRRVRPLTRGRLVLLFQPAEETGKGARAVAEDPRWQELAIDHIIGVHNLPGHPLGEVVVREGVFTAGSVGLIIRLQGRTAHAAYPEKGLSPSLALSRLVPGLAALPCDLDDDAGLAMVTVVHARLGDIAFGTSPGRAEIMATLRGANETTLAELQGRAAGLARREAAQDGLRCRVEWVEEFPVTENDDLAVAVARRAAEATGLRATEPSESPFRWSEDFGWLTRGISGALIGLGSGRDQPALHSPDFDYPDALLDTAVAFQEAVLTEYGLLDP